MEPEVDFDVYLDSDGLTFQFSRFERPSLHGFDRLFVEAEAERSARLDVPGQAVWPYGDPEDDGSLDLLLPCLLGVLRVGSGDDLRGSYASIGNGVEVLGRLRTELCFAGLRLRRADESEY